MKRPKPEQDATTGRFIPGNSGSGGRPRGARSKLGEAFLEALQLDFEHHGRQAIERVRDEKPDQYLKIVASVLPRDLNVNVNSVEDLTDEELAERIRSFEAVLRPLMDGQADWDADQQVTPKTH